MKKERLKLEEWEKGKKNFHNSGYTGINYLPIQEEEPKFKNDEIGVQVGNNNRNMNFQQKSPQKKAKETKKVERERSISETFMPSNQFKLENRSPNLKQFQIASTINSPHLSLGSKNYQRQVNSQYYFMKQISPESQSSQFSHISQPFQNHQSPKIEGMDLTTFKVNFCPHLQSSHNPKHCIYYHSHLDKRRDNQNNLYSTTKCEYYEKGNCPIGDSCQFAHNSVERLYHHLKYKVKFCSKFIDNIRSCEYQDFCGFAHSENEIRSELIHKLERDADFYMFYFKTVWCPMTHEHNKAACVYAHNYQDFRRKPHLFFYLPDICPNWKPDSFVENYYDGCKYQEKCLYSHGWKEQLFHPQFYKTIPCPDQLKCTKGSDCHFYHTQKDKREVNATEIYMPGPRALKKNLNIEIWNNFNHIKEYENQRNKKLKQFTPRTKNEVDKLNAESNRQDTEVNEIRNNLLENEKKKNNLKLRQQNFKANNEIEKDSKNKINNDYEDFNRNLALPDEKQSISSFNDQHEASGLATHLYTKAPIFEIIRGKYQEGKKNPEQLSIPPQKTIKVVPHKESLLSKLQKALIAIEKMEPEYYKNDQKIIPIMKNL